MSRPALRQVTGKSRPAGSTAERQPKRGYGRRRALCLLAVYLLFAVHIIHWRFFGKTLAPLELNEVVYTLELGIVTAGFAFMLLIMLGTIVFGRFFCGWACHILALQDVSYCG